MTNVPMSTHSSNLSDILDVILDKGIVIDVWAKLLLLGTEILRLEARVVVASIETYRAYAEAIGLTALAAAPAAIAAPGLDNQHAGVARRSVHAAVSDGARRDPS